MFAFDFDPGASPEQLYAHLCEMAEAITRDESDTIANMANCASLIWHSVGQLNWAGFYRVVRDELVLGPFIGKPACIRIALGQGVCGTAAETRTVQLVDDVHAFAGHIACDSASHSELVVPVMRENKVIAVIDLDSPQKARFTSQDAAGMVDFARIIASRI